MMAHSENYSFPNYYGSWSGICDTSAPNLHLGNLNNLCELAGTLGKLAADLKLQPDCFDVFFLKLKAIEQEWLETQEKYQRVLNDHNKLRNLLECEKCKTGALMKRQKFLHENQKKYALLKQMYLNIKYNNVKVVETSNLKEGSSQTENPEIVAINYATADIEKAQEILATLKDMVRQREESWAFNRDLYQKLRNQIILLEKENNRLISLVNNGGTGDVDICRNNKEIETYKEIINKLLSKLKMQINDGSELGGFKDDEQQLLRNISEFQLISRNDCPTKSESEPVKQPTKRRNSRVRISDIDDGKQLTRSKSNLWPA